MKNSRMKICTLLLLAGFAVTGCGDKLTPLTSDQENAVVSYSAHVVSKFNKNQTDGVTYVNTTSSETAKSTQATESNSAKATGEQSQANNTKLDSQTESQSTTKTQDASNQSTQEQAQTLPAEKSLTDALGIPSITASVISYGVESQITDQSFTFDLSPETGMKSMVLNIDLTNGGKTDIPVNLVSSNTKFQLVVNNTLTIESEKSSLQSDLSAYNQTIKAGDVNHTVLIFSIPQDTNVSSLQLIVNTNNVSSTTNIL